ncbi:MAG: hypothetical protein JRC90_11665 [Deltaproteobacteria bacterium]|nr:hypothetical protein [Deltaproteobacteria bacterium]
MTDIKKMTAKEFMELGLLQEVNRRFLHPMGLALEVVIDDADDSCVFGGVWDYRDDEEGMVFGEKISTSDVFKEKAERVNDMFEGKRDYRENNLGWHIQPTE